MKELTSDSPKKMTEKQQRILESAIDIFLEKGFAAASTSEIAQRAGVAEGTIFRHYKTKKDLLLSITTPLLMRLLHPIAIQDFVHVLDKTYDHFEDFLRSVLMNRYAFARKHLSVIRILLQELPFQAELREQFMKTVTQHVGDRLTTTVLHFQAKGELAPLPPATIIRLWLSVFIGFVATRLLILPDGDWDDEAEIERCIQFILNGMKK
nr:TetR/AcrR family transcriptional regulator [Gorillibacterium timonense]